MHPELTITEANAERRVETVVRDWLADVPRTVLLMWLRKGLLRVNGRRAAPSLRLSPGDVVQLRIKRPAAGEAAGAPSATPSGPRDPATASAARPAPRRRLPPPEVRYEDDCLLVVHKPAGLAAHPGIHHDHDSLTARIEHYLGSHDAPVGERPGLAQRLDAGVSGLIPCGKHARALKVLMGPPHGPKVHKIYFAVVAGEVEGERGTINLPLRSTDAPRGDVPKAVVDRISGKPARTDYVVLARFGRRTLLALQLHTGRTHQIRAHLRALGHPLLGDARYGQPLANAWAQQTHGVSRPLLHAGHLRLAHPTTGVAIVLAEPLPQDMARLCGGKDTWENPFVGGEDHASAPTNG